MKPQLSCLLLIAAILAGCSTKVEFVVVDAETQHPIPSAKVSSVRWHRSFMHLYREAKELRTDQDGRVAFKENLRGDGPGFFFESPGYHDASVWAEHVDSAEIKYVITSPFFPSSIHFPWSLTESLANRSTNDYALNVRVRKSVPFSDDHVSRLTIKLERSQ